MASFEVCTCDERQPVAAFTSEQAKSEAAASFDSHALLQVRKGATLFYKVCLLLEPVPVRILK